MRHNKYAFYTSLQRSVLSEARRPLQTELRDHGAGGGGAPHLQDGEQGAFLQAGRGWGREDQGNGDPVTRQHCEVECHSLWKMNDLNIE